MVRAIFAFRVLLVLIPLLFVSKAWADEASLEFRLAGNLVTKVSLEELSKKLTAHKIKFFNPLANKEKNYQAFAIQDVLNFAYQTKWRSDKYSDIAFTASDGYVSIGSLNTLKGEGGFLAFRDLDVENGWERVGGNQADPGPFFLIWTGKNQTSTTDYPWPWQIAEINLLRFDDQYPAVIPKGTKTASSAYRGFEIFRKRCMACHSMDRQGGKMGPDLLC